MARIRTIKPDFWTSEQIVECSTNARLLFVGMWNFCDDSGRHPASTKTLKARVFPGDSFTMKEIQGLVDELSKQRLIETYETPEGQCYWQVTGWRHQKIDKPNPSSFPPPCECIRRTFDDHSTIIRRSFTPGMEWNGMDSKGMEGNGDSSIVESSTTEPAVITFPCNGKPKNWNLTQTQIDEWAGLYPGVDILAESRKALAWIKANTPKTSKGMPKFLVGWFGRTNDRQPGKPQPSSLAERNQQALESWKQNRKTKSI